MVDIMAHLHQYVPAVEYTKSILVPHTGEEVQVQHVSCHKTLFGGDQLTVARARGAQRVMSNSVSHMSHIHGLIPCVEDWHTKLNLLGVSYAVNTV